MVAGGRELIDTLWNVNKSIKCAVSGSVLELIDTLWNVNSGKARCNKSRIAE